MPAHAGPALALVALLGVAGVNKLVSPAPTAGALRAAGLPHSRLLVRMLGSVELVVAVTALVTGSGVPMAVAAAMYGGFAWFVINALRRRLPIASCGCLGSTDTPPSRVHVVTDLVAVAVLAWAAVDPMGPWAGLGDEPLGVVVPFVAFTAVTVYLLYALITVLPRAGRPRSGVAPLATPIRRQQS